MRKLRRQLPHGQPEGAARRELHGWKACSLGTPCPYLATAPMGRPAPQSMLGTSGAKIQHQLSGVLPMWRRKQPLLRCLTITSLLARSSACLFVIVHPIRCNRGDLKLPCLKDSALG